METLRPHVNTYIGGRVERGEVTRSSGRNLAFRLEGLIATFGARPLERFGPATIDRWLRKVGHLSPATRHAYVCTVKDFCRWMTEEGLVRRNPAEQIRHVRLPRSVPRALRSADVRCVLDALPDDRARAIVWLLVGLGLRCCEVARLEMGDYDTVNGTVTVTGKGSDQRVVPVPTEARVAIDRYVAAGRSTGPLIRQVSDPNCGLAPHTISVMVARWMRQAGVKRRAHDGVSAHAFRHTAASDVLNQCKDVRVVQQMLGHKHLPSTAIYLSRAHLGQLREAMEGRDYRTPAV